jgi:hypothetical protein
MFEWLKKKLYQEKYIEKLELRCNVLESSLRSGSKWEDIANEEIEIVNFTPEEGFRIKSSMARAIAASFYEVLEEVGAENYITMDTVSYYDSKQKKLVRGPSITIQRFCGETPADQIKRFKAELEELRGKKDKDPTYCKV